MEIKREVPYEAKDKTGNWDYLSFYILGLGYIIINTTMRYQQEFGSAVYNYSENEEIGKEKS